MRVRTRISIIGILVSVITALLSAMLYTGSNVGPAFILTLFFSGFTGGAALAALITGIKFRNKEEKD